jgi:hypothetical protein
MRSPIDKKIMQRAPPEIKAVPARDSEYRDLKFSLRAILREDAANGILKAVFVHPIDEIYELALSATPLNAISKM